MRGHSNIGSAPCPTGKKVLGGGVYNLGTATDDSVNTSGPTTLAGAVSDTSWSVWVNSVSGAATTFRVQAICAVVF